MSTISPHGVEIYYERHGEAGDPLVLVHGFTGDITDWRHQIAELSSTHRLLVLDNRGHGRGSEDAPLIVAGSRRLAADISGAALRIVEGAGHSPQEERPEEFNAILREFL